MDKNESGIDHDAMMARRMLKPGMRSFGQPGAIKAADFFAMKKASDAAVKSGAYLPDSVQAAVEEVVKQTGMRGDHPKLIPFMEGLTGGMKDELAKAMNSKAVLNEPGMRENLEASIKRLDDIMKMVRTEREKNEKIVKRVEDATKKQKTDKVLEREEKIVKQQTENLKETKKVSAEADKRQTLILNDDMANLQLRGKLLTLEKEQRAIYSKDLAKTEVVSKIMWERSSDALKQLEQVQEESIRAGEQHSEEVVQLLQRIVELTEAAGKVSAAHAPEVKRSLEGAFGYGKMMAKRTGDDALMKRLEQMEKATKGLTKSPIAGVAAQLKDWGVGEIKSAARNVYEQSIPMPLRIIAGGAAAGLGKLANKAFGKSETRANYARGEMAYLESQHKSLFDSLVSNSPRGLDTRANSLANRSGVTLPKRSRRGDKVVAPRVISQNISGAEPSSGNEPVTAVDTMQVDKLVVGSLEMLGGNDKAAQLDAMNKDANTLEKKSGGGGLMGLLKGFFGRAIGWFGKIAAGIASMFGLLKAIPGAISAAIRAIGIGKALGGVGGGAGGAAGLGKKALGLIKGTAAIGGALAAAEGAYEGFNTDTADYYERLGLDPKSAGESVLGDLGARTAGVLSDVGASAARGLTFGLWDPSKNFADKQRKEKEAVDAAKKLEAGALVPPVGGAAAAAALTPKGVPDNQAWPDESPAETARMKGKASALSNMAAPSAAIRARTNLVDNVSRQNETLQATRSAKPVVVVNNTTSGGKSTPSAPPITMGAARHQENAFARYLAANFAAL